MTSSKPASAKSTLRRARKSGAIHVCPLSAVPHTVAQQQGLAPAHLAAGRDHRRDAAADPARPPHPLSHPRHLRAAGRLRRARQGAHRPADRVRPRTGAARARSSCTAGPASAARRLPPTRRCAPSIPDASEELIAARLRAASPTAYPNRLMIRLADAALGRQGRMVRAVESIGRGIACQRSRPLLDPRRSFGLIERKARRIEQSPRPCRTWHRKVATIAA